MMSTPQGEGRSAPGAFKIAQGVKAALTSAAIGLALAGPMLSLPEPAAAADKRAVGEISASGLVFKVGQLARLRSFVVVCVAAGVDTSSSFFNTGLCVSALNYIPVLPPYIV